MGFMARDGILTPRDRGVKVNSGITEGITESSKRYYRTA
jgi:hypothetical protein